jgi:hypothetical protein
MTKVTVSHAHHINLTYSGHGKHTATWKGRDEKLVRRTIHLDQWHDTKVAALKAAQLYVDWCNAKMVNRGAPYTQELETVTLSYIKADRHAVAVTMYAVEAADEVAA